MKKTKFEISQTEFLYNLMPLYGIDTETMYDYQLEKKLVKKLPVNIIAKSSQSVTISGRVVEKSIGITTKATRARIRDFNEYEIKTTKLVPGPKLKIVDMNKNALMCTTNNGNILLRANGDIRIIELTDYKTYFTKIEHILMPLYYNQYDKTSRFGKIVNFAVFHAKNCPIAISEFNLISNTITNINLKNKEECIKFQNTIRDTNTLVKVKMFKKEDGYCFKIMFNFKTLMSYSELLVNNNKNIDTIFIDKQDEKDYYSNLCLDYIISKKEKVDKSTDEYRKNKILKSFNKKSYNKIKEEQEFINKVTNEYLESLQLKNEECNDLEF
jgi:hypothetical protein